MRPERTIRGRPCALVKVCALLLATAPLGRAAAQEPERRDTTVADSTVSASTVGRISPRGAMLRSFLVPGWGQGTMGSYRRGGIFFAIRGGSGYMLFKTIGRLNEAREIAARGVRMAMDSLNALIAMDSATAADRGGVIVVDRGLSDPLVYAAAVDSFPGVASARALVRAREQQRQDWITTFIVTTLLDGVDAYVNAQFSDFPVSIDSKPEPGGGASFSLTFPVPWGGAGHAPRPSRAGTGPRRGSGRR